MAINEDNDKDVNEDNSDDEAAIFVITNPTNGPLWFPWVSESFIGIRFLTCWLLPLSSVPVARTRRSTSSSVC